MKWFKDIHNRQIRLTFERKEHIEVDHPEMSGQIDKIQDTLGCPDMIVKSRTDYDVELFYRHYNLCSGHILRVGQFFIYIRSW